MTDQQTRTLADYPVGSRWHDEHGRAVTINQIDDTDLPIEGYWHDPREGRQYGAWSLSSATTWTRIDAPAPDALREAARDPMVGTIWWDKSEYAKDARLVYVIEVDPLSPYDIAYRRIGGERVVGCMSRSKFLARFETHDEQDLPALAQPAPQLSPTPPALDERRWQAALAALTGMCSHTGSYGINNGPGELAARSLEIADALIAAMQEPQR